MYYYAKPMPITTRRPYWLKTTKNDKALRYVMADILDWQNKETNAMLDNMNVKELCVDATGAILDW